MDLIKKGLKMTQYDNNMKGVLFKNDRKEKETHPDYKGNCEINNAEMWVSAWLRDKKDGGKFLSLSFTPKEQQSNPQPQNNSGGGDGFSDEIPF